MAVGLRLALAVWLGGREDNLLHPMPVSAPSVALKMANELRRLRPLAWLAGASPVERIRIQTGVFTARRSTGPASPPR